jgi:hypothetical protein
LGAEILTIIKHASAFIKRSEIIVSRCFLDVKNMVGIDKARLEKSSKDLL